MDELNELEAKRLAALRRYNILDTFSEEAFDDIVRLASEICGTPISLISLVDESRQWFKASIGMEASETTRDVSFCAHAIQNKGVFLVPDATADARFAANPQVTGEPHIRFYAGAPLQTDDGYALGALCVIDHIPRHLTPKQIEALEALSRMVSAQLELRYGNIVQQELLAQRLEFETALHKAHDQLEERVRERTAELASVNEALRLEIVERHALEMERERLLAEALDRADRCPLTGLLNHRAFHHRFRAESERARQDNTSLAVAIVDLNNFKFFNDVYGHSVGDDVLKQVTAKLQQCSSPHAILARFGGDEFTILLPRAKLDAAQTMVAHFLCCLEEVGYRPDGYETPLPLTASVGVAVFPDEGESRIDVLNLAAARLLRAKTGSGNGEDAEAIRLQTAHSVDGFSMLDALVISVDNKDRYTRQHSEDVMTFCRQIAQELEVDDGMRQRLQVAALLHDVGKIGVPDSILRKPGRLSQDEFEAIKLHPAMGEVIVGAVNALQETLPAVRSHHERWDGGGYPDGLRGEEIPLIARIMAVADAFSAMTTDRPYRKGMPAEKARAILAEGAGSQWDPACVAAFLRIHNFQNA